LTREALVEQERIENDRIWATVDVTTPLDVQMHEKSRRCWEQHIGDVSGKRVLDVGCGAGLWSVWLASCGADVVAVDLSPAGIQKTRDRALYHGLSDRVTTYCADAAELETALGRESIDLAVGFSVLHHLPVRQFGRSLRSVLKAGGSAVFMENSAANPLYRVARRVCNNETAAGSPLTMEDARTFISEVGTGETFSPHFKLFDLTPKYVFQGSKAFGTLVRGLDDLIDLMPGVRRWSAGMWVLARKGGEWIAG
jgi:SAM-dependent methyltransferase